MRKTEKSVFLINSQKQFHQVGNKDRLFLFIHLLNISVAVDTQIKSFVICDHEKRRIINWIL